MYFIELVDFKEFHKSDNNTVHINFISVLNTTFSYMTSIISINLIHLYFYKKRF